MPDLALDRLTYLTPDLPGIGGQLKARAEDFVVEEIPLYEPCGEGEHLYLWVQKRRRLTSDVVRILSEQCGVPARQFGFAGLKDKHAVTRQYISVHGADPAALAGFHDDHIEILTVDRHTNKLRRGHLRGNAFTIKLRNVDPTDVIKAKRVIDALVERGGANFAGEQRFGYRRNSHLLGFHLLREDDRAFLDELLGRPGADEPDSNRQAREAYEAGDYRAALELWPTVHRFERQAVGPLSRGASPAQAVNGIDRTQRQLLVSAAQSMIFNRLLNRRIEAGLFDRIVVGDVAMKTINRACFDVLDPAAEQPRMDAGEISPTGPMWGPKMHRAKAEVGRWELDALHEVGLDEETLQTSAHRAEGTRRPLRISVGDARVSGGVDDHGPFVAVSFDLPRGSFATIVMREVMKGPGFWGTEYLPGADPQHDSLDADDRFDGGDDE